jgi:hypothetical protein
MLPNPVEVTRNAREPELEIRKKLIQVGVVDVIDWKE